MTSQAETDAYVPVGEFFAERSVFVTGATGFLGKVLVEKLLRSCPGVKVIYLLVRPKKGRDVSQRLASITNCALFERLKKENLSALEKIVPIYGDIALPEMGISLQDMALLTRTVSVVFHCAATVNFDEPLKVAVNVNVTGTRRVMDMCRKMKELKALVHVSTCYSNCDLKEIAEIIYPPPYDPENIVQCTQWMDDELLAHMTTKILGKRPNTYTLTKALAETVIADEGGSIPITIVRPSIVTSTWNEPVTGWIESLNGPTAVVAATSKGLLRTAICDGSKVTDIVPVDVVINVMICAAWWVATARPDKLTVYNCCTGVTNPINWNQFKEYLFSYLHTYASQEIIWYPMFAYQTSQTMNKLHTIFFQYLPAYLYDLFLKLSGKKAMLVNVQARLIKGCEFLEYFTTRQWRFTGDNIQLLSKQLCPEDAKTFRFDVRQIDWRKYLGSYLFGVRTHVCKEDPKTIPASKKQLQRLLWIHRGFQVSCLLFIGYLLTLLVSFHSLTGRPTPLF